MCGTASPTNATGPAAATAPPASRTKPALSPARVRATFCPRPRAASSPIASAFRLRPETSAIASPAAITGATAVTTPVSRPASEPTIQNRNWSSVCASKTSTALVSDTSSAVRTAPARARLTGLASRPVPPRA